MSTNDFQERVNEIKNFLKEQKIEITKENYHIDKHYSYNISFVLLGKNVTLCIFGDSESEDFAFDFDYSQWNNTIWEYNFPEIYLFVDQIPNTETHLKQILIEQFKVFKKLLKILIKNYYKGK